jgi:thioredoxin-like negative regulator of GroEL
MPSVLARIDEAVRLERFSLAQELVERALAARRTSLPPVELELARIRLALAARGAGTDELILDLEALLGRKKLGQDRAARAHELLAAAFLAKRLPALAGATLDAGEARCGLRAGFHTMRAAIALQLDDRPAARVSYLAALALAPDHGAARLGLGNLYAVMADFAAAERELLQVPEHARQWGAAMRARAANAAALARKIDEISRWRELLARLGDGDRAQSDRIALGLCLARSGDREAALVELGTAWRKDPRSDNGRYARARMKSLEQASGDVSSRELRAFPTTTQKWNYCGPAVLELVLRYFDYAADQEVIAGVVKREAGTPMIEIVDYLTQMGLEARRFVASAERIKRAIDLGCPVIVQEEYSTSSHVAVITGYDDALGTFIAQDPMRHQPMLKSFAFTEAAGGLFGNGAVVVLGPPALAALRRAGLDAAGLVEARQLALVDECARRRERIGVGIAAAEREPLTPVEIIRLCDEAIALAPDFPLAHYNRFRAHRQLAEQGHYEADELLRDVALLRRRFFDDEWPYELHASLLMDRGRYADAFIAALEARRRDEYDEETLQLMGEARWYAGDLLAGERYLLAALAEGPDCVRAAESLAGLYLRSIEALDLEGEDAALDDEVTMLPGKIFAALERSRGDLVRRARHFSRVAIAAHPRNPFNHIVAAELHRREGEAGLALAAFERALELDADRLSAARAVAQLLEEAGQDDEAGARLAALQERFPDNAMTILARAAFLRRHERHGDALAILRAAVDRLDDADRHRLAIPLYETLAYVQDTARAATAMIALAMEYPGDDAFNEMVLRSLEQSQERSYAVGLARSRLARSPDDVDAIVRLAQLLEETGVASDEARSLWQRVVAERPEEVEPRVKLAWLLLGEDPAAALDVVLAVLESEAIEVHDAHAACLEAAGQKKAAAAALARALKTASHPALGLAELIASHGFKHEQHTQRAVRLAERLDLAALARDRRLDADQRGTIYDAWLMAYHQAGRGLEVVDQVRALCKKGVPEELSWEVYFTYASLDHELAARAADVIARQQGDDKAARLEWQINAAGRRAQGRHDLRGLLALERKLPPRAAPNAWASLASAYGWVERFTDAERTARHAYALDPEAEDAFIQWVTALERAGRVEEAKACAAQRLAAKPYDHKGPEYLAHILAKTGEIAEAQRLGQLALEGGPHCAGAMEAHALAGFMAGERHASLYWARRSQASAPPGPDDEGQDDAALILAAAAGDRARLERGLASLERRAPGTYPAYRAHLRAVCAAVVPVQRKPTR